MTTPQLAQLAATTAPDAAARLVVTGVVQGVGFRPFVYRLARGIGLRGTVANTTAGVIVDVCGGPAQIEDLARRLALEAPALARVDRVEVISLPDACRAEVAGRADFVIVASADAGGHRTLVPPDTACCPDCVRELFDPADRRYRHPFITCTNCGPRFTIITDLPYDRPNTTMAGFEMCPQCEREYRDPGDRRFHAQPIACPDCGPRLGFELAGGRWLGSVTQSEDRMAETICPDPLGAAIRRACQQADERARSAGARAASATDRNEAALAAALDVLRAGGIVAVKGIGGYHLAVRADRRDAVMRLRARKHRPAKPLAVMVSNLEQAEELADLDSAAAQCLNSPAHPIALVPIGNRAGAIAYSAIAPELDELGIMLAYSPIHHLLLADGPGPLVMTSGNLSDEPICFEDDDARARLGQIADAFLTHNRPIHVPCDDSVIRPGHTGTIRPGVVGSDRKPRARCRNAVLEARVPTLRPRFASGAGSERSVRRPNADGPDASPSPAEPRPAPSPAEPMRRSRGYAPLPVEINLDLPSALAVGADLKATACVIVGKRAYLSQHLGDMESLASQDALSQAVQHLQRLYGISPQVWACDLHPDYRSGRWAGRMSGGLPVVRVQHHHAHAVSLLAEHGHLGDRALVFTFDGTGYGTDGGIWGGEALAFDDDVTTFDRIAHLAEFALPGGDAAIRYPYRTALAMLHAAGIPWSEDLPCVQAAPDVELLGVQIERGIATARCTSIGRLFDAVASILGVCQEAGYEARAAIELQQLAQRAADHGRRLTIKPADVIDFRPMLAELVTARRRGVDAGQLALAFHHWIAGAIGAIAARARTERGIDLIGLSGGVFANRLLAHLARERLESEGFEVLTHRVVPAGDGGISLGQAVVAASMAARRELCV